MTAPDAPFAHAAGLPRGLQRPGLTTAAGTTDRRLQDLRRWVQAFADGRLPSADADMGDPDAVGPLRAVAQELGLAALCRGQAALAEGLLATLLWHLDHLIDLQPRLTRPQAIAQVAEELRAQWQSERGDWDEAQALLQGLGDLGQLPWDRLRGHLHTREWREARRVQTHLARLPALVALIQRLGRAERAGRAPASPPRPDDTAARRAGLRWVETRLPGLPGELHGITLSGRLDGMLASEAVMLRHPVLKKLWRARHAEA
ncbi:MAG: VWA domain-containing protein, partial [Rubrivivax sp.]|nr:VWA domain-containing protein [Rubrivivax sp.]